MLDEYLWGEARRISPEAPVPVLEVRYRTYNPGGAGNVAVNVASLSGCVSLCGVSGDDANGATLRACLERHGVSASGIFYDTGRPTTTKSRVLAQHQQIVRLDTEDRSPLPEQKENEMLQWIAGRLPDHHACIVSDYGKGVVSRTFAQRLLSLCAAAGKPVVVDPKCRDFSRYRGATVATPNLLEARRAAGFPDDEGDPPRCALRLLRALDGGALLITRGSEGMTLFRSRRPSHHIPACARAVFDVTGAGDTVVATLALALAAKFDLARAAGLANRAAGIAVGKLGAAPVTANELFDTHEANAIRAGDQDHSAPRLRA